MDRKSVAHPQAEAITALAERQESSRRILDLESRVRTLEAQIGPRVLIGGGRSS